MSPAVEASAPGPRLHGQVVLVTGASRGIGRSVAVAMAREGAAVALAARDVEALRRTAEACAGPTTVIELELGDEAACARAVTEAEAALGPVDVLVNAAGIAESGRFLDVTTEAWRRIMLVDVEGPMWLTRRALPGMLERRSGAVVNIASLAARVGMPYVTTYTAAKHALLGLTRALAAEYAGSGVSFNCVCPYYVDTPMTATTIADITRRTGRTAEDAERLLHTPQGRLVDPTEVAEVCVLLASAAGRGITGQAVNVDGGRVQS